MSDNLIAIHWKNDRWKNRFNDKNHQLDPIKIRLPAQMHVSSNAVPSSEVMHLHRVGRHMLPAIAAGCMSTNTERWVELSVELTMVSG